MASRPARKPPAPRSRAPRGVSRAALVAVALEQIEAAGEAAFSVRGLAKALDLDPMTVLHHLGSREGALRLAADALIARLELPPPAEDWRAELASVAAAFRALARRHPRAFPLLLRFTATGPADYAQGERVYAALLRAGFAPARAAPLGLAFYAMVLGLAAAETGGMLQPATAAEAAEIAALDPAGFPATRALLAGFTNLDPAAAAAAGVAALIAGLAAASDAG